MVGLAGLVARGVGAGAMPGGTSRGQGVEVKVDFSEVKELARDLGRISDVDLKAVTQKAMNKTIASMKTGAVRTMAREMGTAQKNIRAGVSLEKAILLIPRAAIKARGRPLNLIRFKAKKIKAGVSAAPWGKRRHYGKGSRVFIANRGRTVFIREGRKRLPIRGMYGPGIAGILLSDAVVKETEIIRDLRWPIEFDRAYNLALRKYGFKPTAGGGLGRTVRLLAGGARR